MATFNSDGIEMRGSAGQILLDINTTGNAVTSTESFGTQINGPFTSGQKETYDMNNYKDRFSNFNGNGTITITITDAENLTDGFPTRTTETYTKSFTSDFSISCLSGKATLSYSHSGKTFTLTFNSNFGSVLYIVETMIQWNYTQYPYNYTFGTRGVNSDIGIGSATIGNNLINTNDNALVVGQYNADDNYLFAVGNGDNDSNRSNAFTVDNYGVVGFSGVAMFGDPSSTFYVTSHTVVNNASVASQSYKDGTITIEKSGYYPLCVAGYNSNTRYLTPTRFYLSNQQSGSG